MSAHTASLASTAWRAVSATTTATGSPTNRTMSVARIGCEIWWERNGEETSGPMSRSGPTNTSTTPGIPRASSTSMDPIRPWAVIDRTNATCSASRGATLSM